MNLAQLEQVLVDFEAGKQIVSIHEKYKSVFEEYLKTKGITTYWVDTHRSYLNYRTSTLMRAEFRNSEVRKVKKITKEAKLAKLKADRDRLDSEIARLEGN